MPAHLTDSLGRRYRATLALVAFLVLLNQLLVLPSLMRMATDAPIINVAGRQRMLSQRLAKAALALNSDDADHRRRYLDELEQVLGLWSASHDGLRHGNDLLSLPGENSRAVGAAFDDLEPLFVQIRTAAEHLINDEARGQSAKAALSGRARDDSWCRGRVPDSDGSDRGTLRARGP